MCKRRTIVAVAIAAVLATAVAVAALTVPSVVALLCPRCYGLSGIGGDAYADRDDPAYPPMLAAADRRIAGFYGKRVSRPRVLICSTAECYDRLGGGGEKGRSIRTWGLMLAPAGTNETIAAHELSHVEFHERLGRALDKVPQWFDEGLAVVVAGDSRYLGDGPDRCLVPYEQAVTVAGADWWSLAANGNDTPYLQAACVVSRWLGEHGGPPAVLALTDRLRAGETFGAATGL